MYEKAPGCGIALRSFFAKSKNSRCGKAAARIFTERNEILLTAVRGQKDLHGGQNFLPRQGCIRDFFIGGFKILLTAVRGQKDFS